MSETLNCQEIIKERIKNNEKVYNFGLGENSLPQPKFFSDSLKEYSYKKNYSSSEGIPELNTTIKEIYSNNNYKVNRVLFGNGLKELLYIIQLSFTGKIFHITPSWVSYKEQILLLNKINDLIEIETNMDNNFKIDIELLDNKLSEYGNNKKLLLLNNPNNPTGLVYSKKEILEISKVLKKHNCTVLADEIYFNLSYNEIKSISEFIPELTLRCSSVSKDLGCGGYRLGWVTFPKRIRRFISYL